MINGRFYWGTMRKAVVAFGNLFNSISIGRLGPDGSVVQQIKVPLSYAPKQKFLARIGQIPEAGEKSLQVVLPRMAFEMVGLDYDPARKLSYTQKVESVGDRSHNSQYTPATWNVTMNLYLYSKNQDDALQVIEQILPYFTPDYNLTMKVIPELDIKHAIPITLQGVAYEDDYEGDFADRRSIMWTLTFQMKLNFYGPIRKEGVIKNVDVDLFNDVAMTERLAKYNANVDPQSANADGSYSVIETWDEEF